MALDLGCLTANVSLPDIPSLNGMTSVPRHPPYNPNGWAISQRISSSMARSTFSIDHMRSLLTELTAANAEPLSVSKVTAMKPVRSTIVYVSVTLALFIIFSVMFVIVSCVNCCRRHSTEVGWNAVVSPNVRRIACRTSGQYGNGSARNGAFHSSRSYSSAR